MVVSVSVNNLDTRDYISLPSDREGQHARSTMVVITPLPKFHYPLLPLSDWPSEWPALAARSCC